jgi:hypothetical protein
MKMKRLLCSFLTIMALLVLAPSMNAKTPVNTIGKAWLDAHADAALINVDGNWFAQGVGTGHLESDQEQQRSYGKRRRLGHHGGGQRQADFSCFSPVAAVSPILRF